MIVRAHFRRHFGRSQTAMPRPPVILSPAFFPRFPKSCQIISFADPHPLTPLESYRFKNRGEGLSLSLNPVPACHPEPAAAGGICFFLAYLLLFFYPSLLQSPERLSHVPKTTH